MRYSSILDLPGAEENVALAPYTSFQIGGPARFFLRAKSNEDILRALKGAAHFKMPVFLLAGGTNVLFSDEGYDGLVVFLENRAYEIAGTILRAEAGAFVKDLVDETIARGLAGLEWAGGLPGTVGGAVRGNAGAFGGEIKDVVEAVQASDREGNERSFSREECGFSYRSSVFKERGLTVLGVELGLKRGDSANLRSIADSRIAYRKERHPLEYPNAGSMFKNVPVSEISPRVMPLVISAVKTDPFPVIPAAFLIAEAGMKGAREGGARVSEKHPNYIVNCGGAKAKNVRDLLERVKNGVQKTFGVSLREEIENVN